MWKKIRDFFTSLFYNVVFIIWIETFTVTCTKGKVNASFIEFCRQMTFKYKLRNGRIVGIRQSNKISLKISKNIPRNVGQRLRNYFNAG